MLVSLRFEIMAFKSKVLPSNHGDRFFQVKKKMELHANLHGLKERKMGTKETNKQKLTTTQGPSIYYVSTFWLIFDTPLPHVNIHQHFNTPPCLRQQFQISTEINQN